MKFRFRSLFLVGIFFGSVGWAMPEYSLREHKQCVYCHYDPRGGGPTNAAGRYFAQHLSLEGYQEKAKRKRKKTPPPVQAPEASASPAQGAP